MAKRRKLLLHAGLPKTGTSALQAWFRTNADSLRLRGIDYPDAFPDGEDKHQFLVGSLRCGNFDTLDSVLAGSASPTIILSSEGLSNHLQDFSENRLAEFRERIAGFDTEILLLTRTRLPWLRSYYRQCIVNPANGASELWGTTLDFDSFTNHPRTRRLLDHAGLIDDLTAAFAAARMIRLDYDDNWFAALTAWLGLGDAGLPPLPRNNETLPDWLVQLMLRVNRSGVNEPERRTWRAALQAYLATNHSVFRQSWHPGWRQELTGLDARIVKILAGEIADADPVAANSLSRFAAFLGADEGAGRPSLT